MRCRDTIARQGGNRGQSRRGRVQWETSNVECPLMEQLLVIDDDPVLRTLLKGALAAPDRDVAQATTAREGLERFGQCRPDVVLLDVHLPDRYGLDLFRDLRQLDGTVPVIFVTSSSD